MITLWRSPRTSCLLVDMAIRDPDYGQGDRIVLEMDGDVQPDRRASGVDDE